jgi:hypothetical protein
MFPKTFPIATLTPPSPATLKRLFTGIH